MNKEVHYQMSQKQLSRYVTISRLIENKLTVKEAAISLGLSTRQILRLKKGVKTSGANALMHKNTGRKPHHAICSSLREKIIALRNSPTYSNANFCHFQELLAEYENIKISYSALYALLKKAGISSPKKRRRFREHRRRKRKEQEGLLIQLDASPFSWLEDGKTYHLHGGIDDATGQLVGLYLAESECLEGYFQTIYLMLELFGIPVSTYSDRHSIFFSPKCDKLSLEDQLAGKRVNLTQFGRAMSQLGVHMIPARSPQAKGRIERLWQTLQSRLTVELKCQGIKTIQEANIFLRDYIPKFNAHFGVEAKEESAFRAVPEGMCLDHILCVIEKRTYDQGGVFSFYHKHFQILEDKNLPRLAPRGPIEVLVSPRFGLKVAYKGNIYNTVSCSLPKAKRANKPIKEKKVWVPDDLHYYKYGHQLMAKANLEESDQEILQMLGELFLSKVDRE
jgi:transposase